MTKPQRVRDIMIGNVFTVTPDMEIIQVMRQLLEKKISGAPVLDKSGGIIGVISKKDCLRAALNAHYHHVWGGLVADYMLEPVETLEPDTELTAAARTFINSRYRRFPVVENDRLIGQVSRSDVLAALCKHWGQ